MVSKEALQKFCGCICKHKLDSLEVEKPKLKQGRKSLSAIINGKEMTVKEIADAYGLSSSTIRQRIHTGKTGFDLIAPTTRNNKKSRVN
jgi:transposase